MAPIVRPTWTEMIDRYYDMNFVTDVVVFNGQYLAEGMVVVPENPDHRGDSRYCLGIPSPFTNSSFALVA